MIDHGYCSGLPIQDESFIEDLRTEAAMKHCSLYTIREMAAALEPLRETFTAIMRLSDGAGMTTALSVARRMLQNTAWLQPSGLLVMGAAGDGVSQMKSVS